MRLLTVLREFDSLQPYQQVLEIVILGVYKYIEYYNFKDQNETRYFRQETRNS